jgi:hypothetical protein
MTKKEITDLIATGNPQVFSIDHRHKTDLQQKNLNAVLSEAKKALAQNKNIHIVLVKQGG